MKSDRKFPWVTITKKQEKTVRIGHPWVYEDEIEETSNSEIENGSLVDVLSLKKQYLGTGIYSANSKIKIRILDKNANETFNDDFFLRRIRYALAYRKKVMGEDFHSCRLIHGEADGLPGVTVDLYENVLVTEILSYGMDKRKEVLYKALVQVLAEMNVHVIGIYERNEGALRIKEGLPLEKGWYKMEGLQSDLSPVFSIYENDIQYEIDVENGQKTGFFLDQKFNRRVIRNVSKDAEVLECCTHIGSFALNAIKGGAKHVTAMDVSESALNSAKRNAELNNMQDKVDFVCADIFELLPDYINKHKKYDAVFIDPPAFTKSRKTFQNAKNGYTKINAQAMRLVKKGGYFATSSCSHFMPMTEFKKMLLDAAIEANVNIRIIEERHAAYDHPVLLAVPETDYLKFILIQVI